MKKDLKQLLVPVDFKQPSLQAVKYAGEMAKKMESSIILLHVIPTSGLINDFFARNDFLVQLVDKAKDKLSELSKTLDPGIMVTNKVKRGKPYELILETAEEDNARMIILGENHQGVDANQELGSTVYHVTLKSPVPVLTLKGNVSRMNDKIVVPLDLTRQMRRQLYSALVYGLNYGAKIYLVSALIGGVKLLESRIMRKLKQAKKTLVENGIDTEIKLFPRSEEPAFKKVMQYADQVDAGMILVMTHQEGYTYDNYIGAFAHHIINESKVPVLSLTSAAADEDFGKYFSSLVDPAGIFLKK